MSGGFPSGNYQPMSDRLPVSVRRRLVQMLIAPPLSVVVGDPTAFVLTAEEVAPLPLGQAVLAVAEWAQAAGLMVIDRAVVADTAAFTLRRVPS